MWIATVPWTCPSCPAEMSRVSRGHAVQSAWLCTDQSSGHPGCPWESAPSRPGHTFGGTPTFRGQNSAERGSFWPDIPAELRPKTSVRPSKSRTKEAFWHRHPARTSTKKLRSEKLRADFSCPTQPPVFFKKYCRTMGGVLLYKWEAYCSTNGRRIAGFPLLRSLEARKVRRYKWGGGYCRTNWRCTAVLFRQVVGVGGFRNLAYLEAHQPPDSFPWFFVDRFSSSLGHI